LFQGVLWMLLPLNLIFQPLASVILTFLLQDDINMYQRQIELLERSRRDAKTSLANSQNFDEHLARTLADPSQHPVSVLFLDLDHFKKVNDLHGHDMGDRVLRELSTRLLTSVSPSDKVARYGGEEFTICLPQCDFGRALSIADRIRIAVEAEPFCTEVVARGIHLTISIGVACGEDISAEQLLRRADKAMYAAKNTGRNRVIGYTMLTGDVASGR
ncbi:MAG: GGDEF domain-containing protein, partial [Bacillota bacterium]